MPPFSRAKKAHQGLLGRRRRRRDAARLPGQRRRGDLRVHSAVAAAHARPAGGTLLRPPILRGRSAHRKRTPLGVGFKRAGRQHGCRRRGRSSRSISPAPRPWVPTTCSGSWTIPSRVNWGTSSAPIEVGLMKNGQWAAVFGNGYSSLSGRAQLFIVEPADRRADQAHRQRSRAVTTAWEERGSSVTATR